MTGMGECLPDVKNKVALDKNKKDKWGMPLLNIDCQFRDNEIRMTRDILNTGAEMLDKAGFKKYHPNGYSSGSGIRHS